MSIQKNIKIYDLVRAHCQTETLVEAVQKVLGSSGEIGASEEQITCLFAFLGLACDLRSEVAKRLDKKVQENA